MIFIDFIDSLIKCVCSMPGCHRGHGDCRKNTQTSSGPRSAEELPNRNICREAGKNFVTRHTA